MAGRSLFVAALQTAGVPGDPAATLDQFERHVRALRSTFDGLQLVVAPELHLMALPPLLEEDGVSPTSSRSTSGRADRAARRARPRDGALARPGSVYERVDEGVANTALVLSPAGELVANYRKCFPWQPYETTLPGHGDGVLRHRGRRPLRARDLPRRRVPRDLPLARLAGRRGDLPGSLTGRPTATPRRSSRARTRTSTRSPRNVNAAAPVGNGRSLVIDPEGAVRYEAGVGEEVMTAMVDLDQVQRVRERGSFGINRLWEEIDRDGRDSTCPCTAATGRGRGRARAPSPAAALARAGLHARSRRPPPTASRAPPPPSRRRRPGKAD